MGVKGRRKNKDIDEPKILGNIESILDLAKSKGLISNYKVNVKKIVEDQGIKVVEEELPNQISGYLKNENGIWKIGVNSLHNNKRKRFTLAHEFAHYLLHRGESKYFEDVMYFRESNDSSIEYKANQFAAELLLPEDYLKEAINMGHRKLTDLADLFNVSVQTVTIRVKELGFNIKSGG